MNRSFERPAAGGSKRAARITPFVALARVATGRPLPRRHETQIESHPGTWTCPPPQVASSEEKSHFFLGATARVAGRPSRCLLLVRGEAAIAAQQLCDALHDCQLGAWHLDEIARTFADGHDSGRHVAIFA